MDLLSISSAITTTPSSLDSGRDAETPRLRNQHHFPNIFSIVQIMMRCSRFGQREDLPDMRPDLARAVQAEDLLHPAFQYRWLSPQMAAHHRARLLRQALEVHRAGQIGLLNASR